MDTIWNFTVIPPHLLLQPAAGRRIADRQQERGRRDRATPRRGEGTDKVWHGTGICHWKVKLSLNLCLCLSLTEVSEDQYSFLWLNAEIKNLKCQIRSPPPPIPGSSASWSGGKSFSFPTRTKSPTLPCISPVCRDTGRLSRSVFLLLFSFLFCLFVKVGVGPYE